MEAANGGLKRCDCLRGVELAALDSAKLTPSARKPVISTEHATLCAEMMAVIPFFPGESAARSAIANEVAAISNSSEEAIWIATRMIRLYRKWPGLVEMRWAFCNSHRPLDGIEALGESEVYPDGIPSEKPSFPAITAPPARQLSPGVGNSTPDLIDGNVSNSPSISATVSDLVRLKDLNRTINNISTKQDAVRFREIPVVKITDENRITYEEIQKVAREVRERKARIEAGLEDSAEKPE